MSGKHGMFHEKGCPSNLHKDVSVFYEGNMGEFNDTLLKF